ncbi:hypothetical protein [Parasphingopyxis lamellibrachiae]|uniref:Uncharacterized protein n=1 Tax=Parasphingopyxis lamellibrachiae TaxID=680125 RepID=A0A3D9FF00_9SPHN|nr:hypothetical protein [Parasphingopyxis lamellibrachiae]RED16157.1 hypothetical protein DFR46_1172 [Parasphingopyxis lamellibrachiae]
MRDEFDSRIWNADHDSVGIMLKKIAEDGANGLTGTRHALMRNARNVGFHGTAMLAAAMVSGTTILAAVGPATGA